MGARERVRLAGAALAASLAALAAPSPADAGILYYSCAGGVSCTLAELLGGSMIQVNSKRFRDFELEFIDPDGVAPNFANVIVTGLDAGMVAPGDGIHFDGNGELVVTGADRLDMAIGFVVEELDASVDNDGNSLTVTSDAVGGTGYYTLGEFVADASGVGIGQKKVENDPAFAPPIPTDAIEFPTLQKTLTIEKDFLLVGSAAADTVTIAKFEQRFTQVPEPGVAHGLAFGSALLVALHRRARRASR